LQEKLWGNGKGKNCVKSSNETNCAKVSRRCWGKRNRSDGIREDKVGRLSLECSGLHNDNRAFKEGEQEKKTFSLKNGIIGGGKGPTPPRRCYDEGEGGTSCKRDINGVLQNGRELRRKTKKAKWTLKDGQR